TLVASWSPDVSTGRQASRRTSIGHRSDSLLLTDFVTDARGVGPTPRERVLLQDALAAQRLVERVR
ncbi:MAG: hypothetical protein ABWZ98_00105, partial [Nakamurella sp.]